MVFSTLLLLFQCVGIGTGCAISSGGGSNTAISTQTTIDIPNGGFYNGGSGYNYGSFEYGTSLAGGARTGALGFVQFLLSNSGTPVVVTQFRLPPNWDSTKAVNVLFTTYSGGSTGGNYKLDTAIYCQQDGTAPTISYNATSTTGTKTYAGVGRISEASSPTNVTTGCSAGNLVNLSITRDNSVSSNHADNLGIVQVSIQLYVLY